MEKSLIFQVESPYSLPVIPSSTEAKQKNGVFHLMFNSCKTADVSHFKSICYIIRIIYGKFFFFFVVNKVVMELLSKHLSFVS